MKIKTKKKTPRGIVRLETSGEVKEVIINEDFMQQNNASISLCFRGETGSGIVELTPKEVEAINKEIAPKLHLLKGINVLKFEK